MMSGDYRIFLWNKIFIMLNKIRKTSHDNLVLCFAGVGSAFAKKNAQTSLIVAKDGLALLIDIGTTIPLALSQQDIAVTDFDYYHITHSHADHIGGVEELLLLSRYTGKTKPNLIITEDYQDSLWRDSLSGGCARNEPDSLEFCDFMTPIRPQSLRREPREMYEVTLGSLHLLIFRTKHVPGDVSECNHSVWSTGLLLDRRVLFTADTCFDPGIFSDLELSGFPMSQVEAIFHDCQLCGAGAVHATYDELKTLPDQLRSKMHLTHYGDTYKQFNAEQDGFCGFARPWHLYEFPTRTLTSSAEKRAASSLEASSNSIHAVSLSGVR
jgi:ribonuclease BN (tRNA processing enzyme)